MWQSIDPDAWTPTGIAVLVRELGPVRIGNSSSGSHAFWNVDMGVAAADEANPYGFRPLRRYNETSAAMMPMERFWEPHTVHYYTGSLLEEDGRASLPVLQHGLDELLAIIERYPQLPKRRPPIPPLEGDAGRAPPGLHHLKIWLGTAGAITPMHYDTQHNVYAQLHGTKDFWLLPPNAARHLYPRVHPLSHFARAREDGSSSFAEALKESTACSECDHCFEGAADVTLRAASQESGRCVMHVRVGAGDVLYLPPFWLHRTECSSPSCASTNVWLASHAMQRMEELDAMPLPFEGSWAPPTRFAAVLTFLRALLSWVHAGEVSEMSAEMSAIGLGQGEAGPTLRTTPRGGFPPRSLAPIEMMDRLLSTRWHRAEEELLRESAQDGRPSRAEEMAAAAACAPRSGDDDGDEDVGIDLVKIDAYAREHAAILSIEDEPGYWEPERSWHGPKLLLVHDQLERIAHWATEGDAAATLALLRRLLRCCELSAAEASPDRDRPPERDEL